MNWTMFSEHWKLLGDPNDADSVGGWVSVSPRSWGSFPTSAPPVLPSSHPRSSPEFSPVLLRAFRSPPLVVSRPAGGRGMREVERDAACCSHPNICGHNICRNHKTGIFRWSLTLGFVFPLSLLARLQGYLTAYNCAKLRFIGIRYKNKN